MRASIKLKIASILFISTFVLTFALVVLQEFLNYRDFEAHMLGDGQAAVALGVDQASAWFQRNLTSANLLGLEMERRSATASDVSADLGELASQLELKNAYFGGVNGTFTAAGAGPLFTAANFRNSRWFRYAKTAKTAFFIGPYRAGGRYVLTFAAPLYDENGLFFKGAVAFDRPFDDLKTAIGHVFISEVDSLELVEKKAGGFVVFARPKGMADDAFAALTSRAGDEAFLKSPAPEVGKEKFLAVYGRIEGTPLWVYYPISVSALLAPLLNRAVFIAAAGAAGIFFIFLFALSLVGRYVERIQAMSRVTKSIAGGDFSARVPKKGNDEIGDLALSFNIMSESLVQYMEALKQSVAARERLKRELELAAEIQQRALPDSPPKVDGAEIAAKSIPAYEVGGDYYDFLSMEKGEVGIVIADAAGKGLSGTLFMTNSRSVFRVIATEEARPDAVLTKMNDFISANTTSGMFITVFYAAYRPAARELVCVNAGHHAPLIYSQAGGNFRSPTAGGLPVGIMPGERYEPETVRLERGDIAVFFTDGVIEAVDSKKEMYGHERLEAAIRQSSSRSAAGILAAVEKSWRDFCLADQQFDDMTMVVLKVG